MNDAGSEAGTVEIDAMQQCESMERADPVTVSNCDAMAGKLLDDIAVDNCGIAATDPAPPDGLYNHGDSNAMACQACDIRAIYELWAAALALYVMDLRASYKSGNDIHRARRDFEGDCRQLRHMTQFAGVDIEVTKRAIQRRLVAAGVINLTPSH